MFDREYARVEVDSNQEIRKQEADEEKKDEFDEDDGDDWDADEWDDFDEGPLADREKKELEKEKWHLVRGRDHKEMRGGGEERKPGRRRRRRKRPKSGYRPSYGDRIKDDVRRKSKAKKSSSESEPDDDRQYVRSSRDKASSQRHKQRLHKPDREDEDAEEDEEDDDQVNHSYRESLYRKGKGTKKPSSSSGAPGKGRVRSRAGRRLTPKSSDRRHHHRSSGSKRRKLRKKKSKKKPAIIPHEGYESEDEHDDLPHRHKRRKHKPKTYSKGYVYIKKKPPSPAKQKAGIDDYDVAYARGNYQAFVDEYDSDRDEDPSGQQSDESAILHHTWKGSRAGE